MIARDSYIQKIIPFIDKPFVKVITGIRRCGKSTIMQLLATHLRANNIAEEQIISINFESFMNAHLLDAQQLYSHISRMRAHNKKTYIFLDEIQEVTNWEKCVNSLMVDFDVDIYITGSNSHLLSSELSTFLAGRYIEIPVFTLSFNEYLQFTSTPASLDKHKNNQTFITFLRMGGFPAIHCAMYDSEAVYKIVYDIYSSIILRDTIQRYNIRDIELLERVVKYAFDNIGNTFSGKNVADFFKSQQRKVDINTIYNYLHALEGAFIVYKVPRYDIKGKEILKTQEKFYVSDVSLLHATMGFKDRNISGILENIVFLELKRRGYSVFIGKFDSKEIDFVAEKQGEKIYMQVTYKLENKETVDREFSTLLAIKDQYPKYVISMDEFWTESVNGVKHLYISDFLLQKEL